MTGPEAGIVEDMQKQERALITICDLHVRQQAITRVEREFLLVFYTAHSSWLRIM
jgi:hypothetical protein